MSHILIVEDEVHLAQGLLFNLEAEGHEATAVESGEAGLQVLLEDPAAYDLVVLDVMLPGVDGFDVARQLRAAQQYVPVLMLTARGRPEDVLKGFESGADDYLPKPFELNILLARINGLLRRTEWTRAQQKSALIGASANASTTDVAPQPAGPQDTREHDKFEFAGRTIDFSTLELTSPSGRVQLTLMEAALLRHFIQHRNQNVSRKQILEEVWGLHEDTDTRAIDNFIVRLRRYIEDEPSSPKHLITVRGLGYRFLPEGQE